MRRVVSFLLIFCMSFSMISYGSDGVRNYVDGTNADAVGVKQKATHSTAISSENISEENLDLRNIVQNNRESLSEPHQGSLNNLAAQILGEQSAYRRPVSSVDETYSSTGINHHVRVMTDYSIVKGTPDKAVISFKLVDEMALSEMLSFEEAKGLALGYEVSFDYEIYTGDEIIDTSASSLEGVVSFSVGESIKTIEVIYKEFKSLDSEGVSYRDQWDGPKSFFVHLSNPENVLFKNSKYRDTLIVSYHKTLDVKAIYDEILNTSLISMDNIDSMYSTGSSLWPYELTAHEEEPELWTIVLDEAVIIPQNVKYFGDMFESWYIHTIFQGLYMDIEEGAVLIAGLYDDVPENSGTPIHEETTTLTTTSGALTIDSKWAGELGVLDMDVGHYRITVNKIESTDPPRISLRDEMGNSLIQSLTLINNDVPELLSSSKIFGNRYEVGEKLPITLFFDAPVRMDNLSITLNGSQVNIADHSGYSDTLSFLFEIPEDFDFDNQEVTVVIDTLEHLSGNKRKNVSKTLSFINEPMVKVSPERFISSSFEVIGSDEATGNISIELDDSDEFLSWIGENLNTLEIDEFGNSLVNVFKAQAVDLDGVIDDIPMYYNDTEKKLVGTVALKENIDETMKTMIIEYLMVGQGSDASAVTYETIYHLWDSYVLEPRIFVDSSSDVKFTMRLDHPYYPEPRIIESSDLSSFDEVMNHDGQLSASIDYEILNDAIWEDDQYEWISNNQSVINITKDGVILFGEPGIAKISFKAYNGGLSEDAAIIDVCTLKVIVVDEGFLTIPMGLRDITIREGQGAKLNWQTNIHHRNQTYDGEGTETIVNLCKSIYKDGVWIDEEVIIDNEVLMTNSENPVVSFEIPAEKLDMITVDDVRRFKAVITLTDRIDDQSYSVVWFIFVRQNPAMISFEEPEYQVYMDTDLSGVSVGWQIENYGVKDNPTEFALEVLRNRETKPFMTINVTDSDSGSAIIPIEKVSTELKRDIYTISVKAKNAVDQRWSMDGGTFFVYNSDAFQIMSDGQYANQITISNDFVSNLTSEEIIALDRKIHLQTPVSLNEEINWSDVVDLATWRVEPETAVTIFDAATGDVISSDQWIPASRILDILGSGAGGGVISVESRNGIGGTSNLTVETLENRLYLLNCYPAIETELNYTNGYGEAKSVRTNAQGQIAIYEEAGLIGNITFMNVVGQQTYFGEVAVDSLESGEETEKSNTLYPVNNILLKKLTTEVSIRLYDDNGPFNGYVTVRGGVTRNSDYCEGITINGIPGNQDQRIYVLNGYLTLSMKPSEFKTASDQGIVGPNDQLKYEYEFSSNAGRFNPKLIDLNPVFGEAGISGNRRVRLVSSIDYHRSAPIMTSVFDFTMREPRNYIESEGYFSVVTDEMYVYVATGFLLPPGSDAGEYSINMRDIYGIYPSGQETRTFHHRDFCKYTYIYHYIRFNKEVLDGWIEPGESRWVVFDINQNGKKIRSIFLPQKIVNMIGVEMPGDSVGVSSQLSDLRQTMVDTKASKPTHGDFSSSSKVFGDAFNGINSVGLDKLIGVADDFELFATDDPLVFRAIFEADKTKTGVINRKYETYSDYKVDGSIYIECEIVLNLMTKEWDVKVVRSSIDVDTEFYKRFIFNKTVYAMGWLPVPLTGKVYFDSDGGVSAKSFITQGDAEYDNFMTYVDLNAELGLFGGVGTNKKNYEISAGIYGQMDFDPNYMYWRGVTSDLINPGSSYVYTDPISISAYNVDVGGEVGIEMTGRLGKWEIVKERHKIAGVSKNYRNDYWNRMYVYWFLENLPIPKDYLDMMNYLSDKSPNRSLLAQDVLQEDKILKGNDWINEEHGIGATNGYTIMENAYSYGKPVISRDGQLILYISDMQSESLNDLTVCYSVKDQGGFLTNEEVDQSFYGDSNVVGDGDIDFFVAAWERSYIDFDNDITEPYDMTEVHKLNQASEIQASVYNNGQWVTQRLTNNDVTDLYPDVATNGQDAIIVWQGLQASDSMEPLEFDRIDTVYYSIYHGNEGEFTDPQPVLPGTGLSQSDNYRVAMLSTGESLIVFDEDDEVGGILIDSNGEVSKKMNFTNDNYYDADVSVVAAEDDGQAIFLLSWTTQSEMTGEGLAHSVIELDGQGMIVDGQYSRASRGLEQIQGNMAFGHQIVRGSDNTSAALTWLELTDERDNEGDILKVVNLCGAGFVESNGVVLLSGKRVLAKFDQGVSVSHYDAIYDESSRNLKSVIMARDADGGGISRAGNGELQHTYDTLASFHMIHTWAQMENSIEIIQATAPDGIVYEDMDVPITITFRNLGYEAATKVTLYLEENVYVYNLSDPLMPNEQMTVTEFIDAAIENESVAYKLVMSLGDDSASAAGNLRVLKPEIGISDVRLVESGERERTFAISLYGQGLMDLQAGRHEVVVSAYKDVNGFGNPIGTVNLIQQEDFDAIDTGEFTFLQTFSEDDLSHLLDSDGELSASGAYVFFVAGIQENGELVHESDKVNNQGYCRLRSPYHESDSTFDVESTVDKQEEGHKLYVTIHNNSWQSKESIQVLVRLWNTDGGMEDEINSEETLGSLLDFKGEETKVVNFDLSEIPADYSIHVTSVSTEASEASLNMIYIEGVPLDFQKEVTEYKEVVDGLSKVEYNIVPSNPEASVEIILNGEVWLDPVNMELDQGVNNLQVTVNSKDGLLSRTYAITIENTSDGSVGDTTITNDTDGGRKSNVSIIDDVIIPLADFGYETIIVDGESLDAVVLRNITGENAILTVPDDVRFALKLSVEAIKALQKTQGKIEIHTGDYVVSIPISSIIVNDEESLIIVLDSSESFSPLASLSETPTKYSDKKLYFGLYGLNGEQSNRLDLSDYISIIYSGHKNDSNSLATFIMYEDHGFTHVPTSNSGISGSYLGHVKRCGTYAVVLNSATFIDMSEHWACENVESMASRYILYGRGDGTFDPDAGLTRAEMAAIVSRALCLVSVGDSSDYKDVSKDDWFKDYVIAVYENELMNGYNSSQFGADNLISREEMMVVVTRIIEQCNMKDITYTDIALLDDYGDSDLLSPWAKSSAEVCLSAGIVKGNEGNIEPNRYLTRAEAAVMIYRTLMYVNFF